MLKRLRVDNFRSLGNTTLEPGRLSLLIGENGSGKTSLFEVLDLLRRVLVEGARVGDLFAGTLTRWRPGMTQGFGLCMEVDGSVFEYELVLEHLNDGDSIRIEREHLALGERPLYEAERGAARVYREDHPEGVALLVDRSRSGIPAALELEHHTTELNRFSQACSRILLARISPMTMLARADGEAAHPLRDFSNFAAWYRHLEKKEPERVRGLFADLSQVTPGFKRLKIVEFPDDVGDLQAEIECSGQICSFRFTELSDGQRSLVALYTILHCAAQPGALLLLDEPDNFVALPELQPWLVSFADKMQSADCQAIVISHHPECIDYLAGSEILRAKRVAGGATVVGPWQFDASKSLSPSEAIARGWIDE